MFSNNSRVRTLSEDENFMSFAGDFDKNFEQITGSARHKFHDFTVPNELRITWRKRVYIFLE